MEKEHGMVGGSCSRRKGAARTAWGTKQGCMVRRICYAYGAGGREKSQGG